MEIGSGWKRRDVLTRGGATLAAVGVSIAEMRAVGAAPSPKSPLCAACSGHGNCESDACVDGFCAKNRDVCPESSKRNLYRCKGKQHDQPRCCKANGRKCRQIS